MKLALVLIVASAIGVLRCGQSGLPAETSAPDQESAAPQTAQRIRSAHDDGNTPELARSAAPTAAEWQSSADHDLPPRDGIIGRVVSEGERPVPGVLVRLWRRLPLEEGGFDWRQPPMREESANQLTDGEGRFRFERLLGREYALTAEGTYGPEHRFPIPPGSDVEIRLGSGNRLLGRVVCQGHEQEAFRGTAILSRELGFDPWLAVPIAPDGRFTFSGIPPEHYSVSATVTAHATDGQDSLYFLSWSEEQRMELSAEPGQVVTGKVVHAETGAPIQAAEVSMLFVSLPPTLTDASGAFRLDQIPDRFVASGQAPMIAEKEGFLRGAAPLSNSEPVVISLAPAPSLPLAITGRLVDADGHAVAGARVSARREPIVGRDEDSDAITPLHQMVRTGADGRFELRWIHDRDFNLDLWDLDEARYLLLLNSITADLDLGEIRLPAVRSYRLRIVDEAGQAVPGVRVSASQSVTHPAARFGTPGFRWGPVPFGTEPILTDTFGRCVLRTADMEDGDVEVSLGPMGGWSFSVPDSDAVEHEFVLDNLRRVEGRVRHADGAPVAGGWLEVLDLDEALAENRGGLLNPFSSGTQVLLGHGGAFLLYGRFSPALKAELKVVNLGGFHRIPELRLDQGPIEILLPTPTHLSGTVHDAAGTPVADAHIMLVGEDGKQMWLARSEADGSFAGKALPEPNLRLVARVGKRRSAELSITEAVAPATAELVLPPE